MWTDIDGHLMVRSECYVSLSLVINASVLDSGWSVLASLIVK